MFTLLPALAILSALFVLAGVIQFAYRIHKYNRARSTFDLRSNGRSSPRTSSRNSRPLKSDAV